MGPNMWTESTSRPNKTDGRQTGDEKSPVSNVTAVNWHCEPHCNYSCSFCYAPFVEQQKKERLSVEQGFSVLKSMKEAGVEKVNFVGGEPMLHRHIKAWIKYAKGLNLTTSIVSNGTRMTPQFLEEMSSHLDWLGLSIDASKDELHAAMGRGLSGEIKNGVSNHLERSKRIIEYAKKLGYGIKLNTVVCSVNLDDDMENLVRWIAPDRWKIFQVLSIKGENDHMPSHFAIKNTEFKQYVERHQVALSDAPNIQVVPESNEQMLGTYAMMDAQSFVYTNQNGRYEYSKEPVSVVGFSEAWSTVSQGFSNNAFEERGGTWNWDKENSGTLSLPMVDTEAGE